MSPDRREGQPHEMIRLLKPVPDISLPNHVVMLEESIEEFVGDIIYADSKLIVSLDESTDKHIPTNKHGFIYVHNQKNGLPNYAARYKKIKEQYHMESAFLWDYAVVKDPDVTGAPILATKQTALYKPSSRFDGSHCTLKSILNLDAPEELLLGEGTPENFYDEDPPAPFDERSRMIFDSVREQMNRIPNLPPMY